MVLPSAVKKKAHYWALREPLNDAIPSSATRWLPCYSAPNQLFNFFILYVFFFVYTFILCFVCSTLLSVLGYPERRYTNEMYYHYYRDLLALSCHLVRTQNAGKLQRFPDCQLYFPMLNTQTSSAHSWVSGLRKDLDCRSCNGYVMQRSQWKYTHRLEWNLLALLLWRTGDRLNMDLVEFGGEAYAVPEKSTLTTAECLDKDMLCSLVFQRSYTAPRVRTLRPGDHHEPRFHRCTLRTRGIKLAILICCQQRDWLWEAERRWRFCIDAEIEHNRDSQLMLIVDCPASAEQYI